MDLEWSRGRRTNITVCSILVLTVLSSLPRSESLSITHLSRVAEIPAKTTFISVFRELERQFLALRP